jgi:hypothetical protein
MHAEDGLQIAADSDWPQACPRIMVTFSAINTSQFILQRVDFGCFLILLRKTFAFVANHNPIYKLFHRHP